MKAAYQMVSCSEEQLLSVPSVARFGLLVAIVLLMFVLAIFWPQGAP
jgi:hypothetical protein